MSPQNRYRITQIHERLKPYYAVIGIILSTLTLSWEITHAAFSVITSDTKELHANTAAILQQRKDLSELKLNTAATFEEMKCDNRRRDNRIQQNMLDIKGLLTENKK